MHDELISREGAIDALADYIHNVDKVMGTGNLTEDDCKDAAASVFEELPSAQSKQRWIPVTERLPEENTPVLLGVRFKDDFKYFVTARVDYNYWTGLGRDIRGELAWMPLPKPWKEANR